MKAFTIRTGILALIIVLTGAFTSWAVSETTTVTIHILNSSGAAFTTADLNSPGNCHVDYYKAGIWYRTAVDIVDGDITVDLPSNTTSLAVWVNWKRSAQIDGVNLSQNAEFTFQTKKVILSLASCVDGTIQVYDKVTFSGGFSNGNYPEFPPAVDGKTSTELFPGSHNFDMWVNGTRKRHTEDIGPISSEDYEYEYQFLARPLFLTMTQNINYITFYATGWRNYVPGMFLFAGTYPFVIHYIGMPSSPQIPLTIEACPENKDIGDPGSQEGTIVSVKLESSTGAGIAGGTAFWLNGSWQPFSSPNTTPASGILYDLIPANKTIVKFHMEYKGGQQDILQNITINPNVVFKTKAVTASLQNSLSTPESIIYQPGGVLRFYDGSAGEWVVLGNTDTYYNLELLNGSYMFDVKYLGKTKSGSFNIGINPDVVFKTQNVHVGLYDIEQQPLTGYTVKYLSGTWLPFGTEIDPYHMEMLPVSHSFNVAYMGKTKVKSSAATEVPFYWNGTILSKLGLGDIADNSDGITNVPNPFTDMTNIRFNLVSESNVKVTVYNAAGTEISTLCNGTLKAGDHEYMFSADGLASGAYYCLISVDGTPTVRPMLIAK